MSDVAIDLENDPAMAWRFIDRLVPRARQLGSLRRRFLNLTRLNEVSSILKPAPVIELNDRFYLNMARRPAKSSWRWIIAVRAGAAWPEDGVGNHLQVRASIERAGPSCESLYGQDVLDLVACSADLLSPTARFLRTTAVIGWPIEATYASEPVRVFETPWAWLQNRGAGVVLVGDDQEQGSWLRDCQAGIQVASKPLRLALERKMRRPVVALPKVLVDA